MYPHGPQAGDGPGVPEARRRALSELADRLDPTSIDRIWIFPPLVRGRRERGLLALSLYRDGSPDRSLVSLRYTAELTGKGVEYSSDLVEEGDAGSDRLPRVIEGVARRSEGAVAGDPRLVAIEGSLELFTGLLSEGNDEH
jgi:hypothetical protein